MYCMTYQETLIVDLDSKILRSPRFAASSIKDYFRESRLKWWCPTSTAHKEQECDIERYIGDTSYRNVAELGAGFGRITDIVASHAEQLTLVEINERASSLLVKKFPNAQVINTAVENFQSWQAQYDLIIAIAILMHIPNIPELMKVVASSVVFGGNVIVSIVPKSWYKNNRSVIHRGIDPDEFEQLLLKLQLLIMGKTQHDQILTYFLCKNS